MTKDIASLIAPLQGNGTPHTPQEIPTEADLCAFEAQVDAEKIAFRSGLGYETVSKLIGKCLIVGCDGDLFLETYWENTAGPAEEPQMVPKGKCFCALCKTAFKLPHNDEAK
jgi:hypothetical protein